MANRDIPNCCIPEKRSGIKSGIFSGIIPHAGCIAIILFSILGITAGNAFFRKFFFSQYYLYAVFVFSFIIASIAAFFYIKRFSDRRIKTHWKYLSVLYLSVILVNLMMIYLIFPYATNLTSGKIIDNGEGTDILKLSFEIPCSGHAPLVISELQAVQGIKNVRYISGNDFEVYYNPQEISKEKILGQDICKEFNAKEV